MLPISAIKASINSEFFATFFSPLDLGPVLKTNIKTGAWSIISQDFITELC